MEFEQVNAIYTLCASQCNFVDSFPFSLYVFLNPPITTHTHARTHSLHSAYEMR